MSKQQHGVCAYQRLSSAWASPHSDQSHCCCALSWSLSAKVFFMQAKKTELMHWQIRVFSTCWFTFLGLYTLNIDTQVPIVDVLTLCILDSVSRFFVVCFFLLTKSVLHSLNLDQDGLSVLILIQSDCQDYQQTTKVIAASV